MVTHKPAEDGGGLDAQTTDNDHDKSARANPSNAATAVAASFASAKGGDREQPTAPNPGAPQPIPLVPERSAVVVAREIVQAAPV